MGVLLLTIRLVLAAVLAVAGVAKLLDRAGSRRSMREFGVPAALATPLAVLLPSAELAFALALLTGALAWWGAIGALALLSVFIVAIATNLARGRTPDCHCFGALHSEPVGWTTVARNVVLAGLAAFVVVQGPPNAGPGLVGWLASLSGTESMLLGVTMAVSVLIAGALTAVVQLLAQNGRLMLRIEAIEAKLGGRTELQTAPETGLAVNTDAPVFSATGLDGAPVTLQMLGELGKPLLLFFSEPGCSACESLLPDVGKWQRQHGERLLVVPISRGDMQVNKAKGLLHGLEHMLLQTDREVAEAYRVQATPSAVLVRNGQVASPLAAGADAIRALVFSATLPAPVKQHEQAPSLELSDLDGKTLNIATLKGRRTVLLFWNPACGFCSAMLSDLKSWERTRSRHAPELLVVSTGTPEANREQRFRSRVLLDQSFGAGQVFGVSGTPSAVVLDERGLVASDVSVGAPAVLAMLGAVPAENAVSG
jgi:thioredoxin-related protein/uncharacterized membrane protein YphA (DoxX/SURF4 family)